LAGGLLSGKYRQGEQARVGRIADAPDIYKDLLVPSTFEAIEALRDRANRLGCSVPTAALRFVLDTPGVSSLIIAPRSIAQFDNYGVVAGG
jgi:aryl-alcohol dehydrogenase-like predicted oxidoreductase